MKFRLLLYLCFYVVFITNAQTVEQDFARYKRLADQCFNQKKYDCARKNYSIANQLKNDSYCQQRINETNVQERLNAKISIFLASSKKTGNLVYAHSNGKAGMINLKGEVAIPFIYESIIESQDDEDQNLLYLHLNGKSGIADMNGKIIIPFQFDEITARFSENYAAVVHNGKQAIIDKTGKITAYLPPNTYIKDICHEGLFKILDVNNNEKYGFVNTSGQIIIPPKYEYVSSFSDGLSCIQIHDKGLYGYINKKGETVIPFIFKYANGFNEGLASVSNTGGKYGFIDTKGNFIIPQIFPFAGPFSDGLAEVRVDSKYKYGYINKKGELQIPAIYDGACNGQAGGTYDFKNNMNMASVCIDNKVGVINNTGKIIIPIKYDYIIVSNQDIRAEINISDDTKNYYRFDKFGNILNSCISCKAN